MVMFYLFVKSRLLTIDMRNLKEIIEDIESRTVKGAENFYKPLENEQEREVLYEWYRDGLIIPENGSNKIIINNSNTIIASGYDRIVIGDFGPYVEISKDQIYFDNIKPKWSMTPNRPVKYIWMETNDLLKTKIYFQKGRVKYADYKPEFFYVDPNDVRVCEDD